MHKLSISRAWDETKAVVQREGRLLTTVALALIALPSAIGTFFSPESSNESMSMSSGLVLLITSLITIVGQLALLRMAIGPSVSVGGAISHGARRTLPYLGSLILLVILLLVLAIPLVVALTAMGVSFEAGGAETLSPAAGLAILIFLALLFFIGVRMLMSAPVASAEDGGPLAILRRSWHLTSGHGWKLFGFLILFFIAALIALGATAMVAVLLARSMLGEVESMSASALFVGLIQGLVTAAMTVLFSVLLARIYTQLANRGEAQVSVPSSAD